MPRDTTKPGGRLARSKVHLPALEPTPPTIQRVGQHRLSRPALTKTGSTEGPIAVVLGKPLRDAYAALVDDMERERSSYVSDSLFCEALMSKARTMEPVTHGELSYSSIQTAAACWALNILAENDRNQVIRDIRDALVPALFVDYKPPVEEEGDPNPFLNHDLYCSQYVDSKTVENRYGAINSRLREMVTAKTTGFQSILRKWNAQMIGRVFTAWRRTTRRERIDRFARQQRTRLFMRESRGAVLQACFSQWRLEVETGKKRSLEEHLHATGYHLENAKNQFQLQCYRSDKYLRTVEDLREELAELRNERDKFRNNGHELERQLRQFKDQSAQDLNYHINNIVQMLNVWREFARKRIEDKLSKATGFGIGENQSTLRRRSSMFGGERSMSIRSASGFGDGENGSDFSDEELPDENETSRKVDTNAEKTLLKWVNGICRKSVVAQLPTVTNFTEDYQSGEVLLFLMHHVFPNDVPFSPLQETNIPKRLDLIVGIGKELGIAHLPKSEDIMECTGDLNVMVTAELLNRFLARQLMDTGREKANSNDSDDALKIKFDIDMLDTVMREASDEMKNLQDAELALSRQEVQLLDVSEAVTRHAGYLTRERLAGNPVQVLDKKEVAKYCRINKQRYRDIEFKYKNQNNDNSNWLPFDDQLLELRKALRRHFHTARRVFRFYAGPKPTMSDADFWRFCGDIRVMDKTFSRATIDRIFAIANMDDVPLVDDEGAATEDDESAEEEDNPATELIASEFVECLIRMADVKVTGGKMIQERYDAFINNFVSPFACKNEMDRFKKEIYAGSSQAAVQRYLKDLQRLYQHFARVGSGKKKMMSLDNFTAMLKEGNIMSTSVDDHVVTSVFKAVHGDESTGEITLHQFLEVLVSCSVFKTANPFIGLDKKIDILATNLISTLRAKLKGIVPLSDLKPVTLQQLQR